MTGAQRTELEWVRFRLERLCDARCLVGLSLEERWEYEQLGRRERELLALA